MKITTEMLRQNLEGAKQRHPAITREALIEAGIKIGQSEGSIQILGQLLQISEQPEPVTEPQLATEPEPEPESCPAGPQGEAGTPGEDG